MNLELNPPQPNLDAAPSSVPLPVDERLPILDLIRGVAILMILPANMPFFSGFRDFFDTHLREETGIDQIVYLLTLFFVDFKFITQLSILFGVGLAIQRSNADRRGEPFVGYYLRRMGLLFLLGLAHGVLLWYGDILLTYSLVGTAALILSRLERLPTVVTTGVLLMAAYSLMVMGCVVQVLFVAGADTGSGGDSSLSFFQIVTPEEYLRIFRAGTLGEIFSLQARLIAIFPVIAGVVIYPTLLACFLLGRYFFQSGFLSTPEARRACASRFLLLAGAIGIPLHLAAVAATLHPRAEPLSMTANMLGAIPMALGYFGLLILWDLSGRIGWLQRCLRDVGRTALSNYILQSVICFFVFYGPGLGLYAGMSRLETVGVVVGIWIVEILVSLAWLRIFRMGPIEWVWRSLADGRRQPLLRGTKA